jgi:23S rRNA (guanosine2251-2'-O)-methyltransferase
MAEQQWVFGLHAVEAVLQRHPEDVLELLVQKDRDDRRLNAVREQAQSLGIRFQTVDRRELEKRLGTDGKAVHQGVAAHCRLRSVTRDEAFLEQLLNDLDHPPLLLVLDEITDPHNLGACLRSADAAGVDAVIVPKDRSAPVNMTVRKVASGAAEAVNLVAVTNLARTLEQLKARGIWLSGAAGESAQSLYSVDFTVPTALVMGSEGKGMRRLTREHCDYLIAIPMAGSVSSLNVSVATGICLYEAVRQRQTAGNG